MKISVITRHAPSNYGSLLQTIATTKIIERLGHTCEIVDYIREDEHYYHIDETMLQNNPKWNSNKLKRIFYLMIRKPETILTGIKFEQMRKQYLQLSKRYSSIDELFASKPRADIYLTGSDQVWGKIGNKRYDAAYFLTFTNEHDRKVAYAASFGNLNVSDETKKLFQKMLKRYSVISTREMKASKLIEEMGLSAKCVLDPTLMLTENEWNQFCKPIQEKKYVLVYQIHNDNHVGEFALKVAKKKKLPLLRVSPMLHQIFREGKIKFLPNLGEFLSYIKNAEYFITDSFHGTSFALIFNIPFVDILYNNGTEGRNVDLLEQLGLSSRILKDDNISIIDEKIDFIRINKLLDEKRAISFEILNSMLES